MSVRKVEHPASLLKAVMEQSGLTTEMVAKAAGVDRTRVAGILARQRRIVPETARGLAKVFDVAPWNDSATWLQVWDDYENHRACRFSVPKRASAKSGEKHKINVETREHVLELVSSGMTSEEAGAEVGLSKMSVAGIRSADTKGQYE